MDITMRHKTLLLSTVGFVFAAQALPAAAQAQPEPMQDERGEPQVELAQRRALGEIIVTARKRGERLLDVPVAVSALSSEEIERYATNSLTAISQQVPQLIVAESQNQVGGSINLRGIGAGVSNPSIEQAVTLNLDGIPISSGNAIRLGQIDVERIEVLKGPQALFYGKNSPGGIISLISADPGDYFEAKVRTGYEFVADQRFVEGAVSGPLTDTLGARLVGYYSKEDGWFRNTAVAFPGRTPGPAADSLNGEDVFLRGTLAYEAPGGDLEIKAKANYGERQRSGIGPAAFAQIVHCPLGFAQTSGRAEDCGLDRNFANVALRPEAAALHPALRNGVPFADSEQFLGSVTATYQLNPSLSLTSVTGYYEISEESFDSFTFTSVPAVSATNDLTISSFSQELRLASDFEGPVDFILGGFYQDGEFTSAQVVPIDLGGSCPSASCFLTPYTDYDQDTRAISVFGQVRYELTDQLELSAGGRYSWETKELTGTVNQTAIEILNPERDYEDFSPEVTLTYKPTPDLTAYASYREGFTSGGFNTVPTAIRSAAFPTLPLRDLSYGQMTAQGGEVGFKGYLADRQILFDLVGYYYEYEGLQLSAFDTVGVAQITQNAGGAKVRGVELRTVYNPIAIEGLELHQTVAYNKATYTDFIGACYPGQTIAAGCNLVPRNLSLDPATFGTAANPFTSQDQSGQQIARAPEWTLSAGFVYERELSDALGASIALDAIYTSSYMTQVEAQREARQDDFWMLNGAISIHDEADEGWEISLIGRNLTNEIVRVSGGAVAFTGTGTGTATTTPADLYGSVSLPRSVLLQLTLRNTLLGR
jgi:iron complex outermembrane receptor protein